MCSTSLGDSACRWIGYRRVMSLKRSSYHSILRLGWWPPYISRAVPPRSSVSSIFRKITGLLSTYPPGSRGWR